MKTWIRKTANILLRFELWIVGFAVLISFLTTRALPFAILLAAFFWLLNWLGGGLSPWRTPADWSIGLLAIMALVTLWITPFPELTQPQALRLLAGIGMYYAVIHWAGSTSRIKTIVLGFCAAGLALALIAPFTVEWSANKLFFIPASLYSRFQVLVSDSANPNVMAGTIVILLPVTLAMLLFGSQERQHPRAGSLETIFLVFSALAMTAVLALTLSRGAWLAFGVVILVLVTLRWRWGWVIWPLSLAGVAAAGYFAGFSRLAEAALSQSTLGNISLREEVWSRALFMIRDFPFTGIGMGGFSKMADLVYPFLAIQPGSIPHAHNLFLQVAVDLGLPGLVFWLATWLAMIVSAWQVYRVGRSRGDRFVMALGAGLLGSQAALGVHGLVDSVTWGMVRPAPLVWALWGLSAASLIFYGWGGTNSRHRSVLPGDAGD